MLKKLFLACLLSAFSFSAFAIPVNINKADAQTIANSLKNIGLVKAQAIVEYRDANGPFLTVADLAKVKGIGIKTVEMNEQDILLED